MNEQAVTYKGRNYSVLLLLIIGVLAILLWWKSCGGNKGIDPQVVAQMKAESDSRYNSLLDHDKAIEDSVKDLQGEKELTENMLHDAAKELEKMFLENDKLRAAHEKEPSPIPFDSNSSIVSNKYILQCDTCFMSLKRMEDTVKSAKKTVDRLGEIHQKQLQLKDTEILLFKRNALYSKRDYDNLLNKYEKLGKGKASMSAGIEYGYSQPVSNIGVYLQFRTRRGPEFSIGGGGNTLSKGYISGRVGMRIF